MADTFGMSTPEQFWQFFLDNLENFDRLEEEEMLDQIHRQLAKYNDGLALEVGMPESGERELVISAEGNRELFPVVEKLCKAAPEIPGWKITAFRPRVSLDFHIEFAGRVFNPDELWVDPILDGDELDLIIFHPEYSDEDRDLIVEGSYILLDMAIGEYDVATGIRAIDHQPLPEDPEAEGLVPFRELPAVFDYFKSKASRSTH